jgi:uncharacterized repeat protein (TIGR01451 family)
MEADGATGLYEWLPVYENGRAVPMEIDDDQATVRFSVPGTYHVEVESGSRSDSCEIVAQQSQTTPVPGILRLVATGRNASTGGSFGEPLAVRIGQYGEVRFEIRNTSSTVSLNNLTVRAVLPDGLAYVPGTAAMNGTNVGSDTLAVTGYPIGGIGPGQRTVITFRIVPEASSFSAGTTSTALVGQVYGGGVAGSDILDVDVTRATAGIGSQVKTGPGEALLTAFLISAIMTLLYVSYTHTSTYRRREVDVISKQRDPLDFRS